MRRYQLKLFLFFEFDQRFLIGDFCITHIYNGCFAADYSLQKFEKSLKKLLYTVISGNKKTPTFVRVEKSKRITFSNVNNILKPNNQVSKPKSRLINARFFALQKNSLYILRKEVIQPHLPIRLPCYDFTPVTGFTFGCSSLAVRSQTSGASNSHGVTGGVYKTRERIHRDILIRDY